MTIPSLMTDINNKVLAISLKNNATSIQSLIGEELSKNKTNDLAHTDFSSAEKLLTKDYFDALKICIPETSLKECWKLKSGDDYAGEIKYKTLAGTDVVNFGKARSVILKNGAVISYHINGEDALGSFYGVFGIDVNGSDGPNILCRDFFSILITRNGKIIGANDGADRDTLVQNSKYSLANCFSLVMRDNWKIKY